MLPPLFKAIKRKFPKRKWPQQDKRKSFQCLETLLDTIGDGKAADVLADFLATSHRQDMKKCVSAADPVSLSLLENIKSMLSDCADTNSNCRVTNSIRISLIKLLLDLPGLGRDKLMEEGFEFGTNTYTKALEDKEEAGMRVFVQAKKGGRVGVDGDLRDDIRDHCMDGKYTKKLPLGRHKLDSWAFTVDVRQVYDEFHRNAELAYNTFRDMVSGKKDSATPHVRKWLHQSDKCQTCPQRQVAIAVMQKLVSQATVAAAGKGTDVDDMAELLEQTVQLTQNTADPTVGANELKKIDDFIGFLAANTTATVTKVREHMEVICAIGHHVYQKNVISKSWKESLTYLDRNAKEIIVQADWKMDLERNVGPVEDSSAFHNREHTAVFGMCLTFWSLKHAAMGRVFIPILTNVLDKTAEAATHLIEFAFEQLMTQDWFQEIFSVCETVKTFIDAGNHFKNEAWLYWALISVVRKYRKRHIVQFFLGGHGKTGEVDGTVFGSSGVGGAYNEFIKLEFFRCTSQLFEFCIARADRRDANKSEKQKDLRRWFHLLWEPPKFPTSVIHLRQAKLKSLFCWESTIGFGIKIVCHGIAYNTGTQTEMRSVRKPTDIGEYRVQTRHPGFPKAVRTAWRIAPPDVTLAPPANTTSLRAQQELHTALLSQSSSFLASKTNPLTLRVALQAKRGPKQPSEQERCAVKKLYSNTKMAGTVHLFKGKGQELQDECQAHGVSQSGTMKIMLAALRKHYSLPHVDRTWKSTKPSIFDAWASSTPAQVVSKGSPSSSSSSSSLPSLPVSSSACGKEEFEEERQHRASVRAGWGRASPSVLGNSGNGSPLATV
jgi:hypothetical protein